MENSDRDVKSYNFVNDQVWSMLYHMEKYKKFTPGAWYTGCYCDWLQILIYRIFDYVYNNPESSLEEKLKGIKMYDGEGNEFINDKYIHDLFFTIDKQLKITLEEQKIIKKNNRLVNRIKRFFHINI
ncbi:MAG TPA: hypothetical protein VK153_02390 [Candidatus Paceibacterota bacterium]|nr:hypothetical protein [Candidatus Paceibacterota bacterium]